MKFIIFVFAFSSGFFISGKAFSSSIVSSDEKIWMIGCDGKVYERSNNSGFKPLVTNLPNGVAAKDLMFRKILISGFPGGVGSGAAQYDDALYVVGTDGSLYVNSPNGNGFELSKTQPPATAKCETTKASPATSAKPARTLIGR